MSISVICACKNRNSALRVSLNSWLNFKEISEIIVVDWSSDDSLEEFLRLDNRIKIVRVDNKEYFNQPQPLNLAISMASGDTILKLDTDYVINPYYNFFETYKIDDNSFVSGKIPYKSPEVWSEQFQCYVIDKYGMSDDELRDYYNSYSDYYKYLTGLLYISKENLTKIGGYNENLGKFYAFEDDEIYRRLELLGLEHRKLYYDHRLHHIPHSDAKRTENFEGFADTQLNQGVKISLGEFYSGEELEWQTDYAISMIHIQRNEEIISEVTEAYVEPKTKWKVEEIKERYYSAKIIEDIKLENQIEKVEQKNEDSKLGNFPTVYYVSLEESEDRRKNLHEQFSSYGVNDLVPIISKRFSECDDKVYGEQLHVLDGGTTGCIISHIKAIRKWYDETDDDYAFFCEDDLSLETVKYWNFTWDDFIETIPEDAECVQLCCIRSSQKDVLLRERTMYDWSVTAYIITRDYAEKIIERYCDGDSYRLEIPGTNFYPMPETVFFYDIGKVYSIELFVEDQNLKTTFAETANIESGNKDHHVESYEHVINWWKDNGSHATIQKLMRNFSNVEFTEEKKLNIENKTTMSFIQKTDAYSEIEDLLTNYAKDPENPSTNFAMGLWYERFGHTAPALSYFLRAAERSTDDTFSYESLLKCHHCYDRQGTRDITAITLAQQAVCLMPKRPEAYFLLARFHERRHQWNDCYKYSSLALSICDFNLQPLKTNVEYPGYYGLLFEKAVSGWWWGKTEESKEIFLDLYENYNIRMDSKHYSSVIENLKLYGINKE